MSIEKVNFSAVSSTANRKPTTQEKQGISRSVPTIEAEALSLKVRLKEIPRHILEFFKDEAQMSLIVEFFGIASRSMALAENSAWKDILPYLSIASSPFYLYHALKHSKERFSLMMTAARTARFAEAFFWFGRGVETTGTALSEISKPFAGGFELKGLTIRYFALGLTFTLIIPILQIVFGAIGGFAKGWAMIRTQNVLKRFNEEANKEDGSLKTLENLLHYLQGPSLINLSTDDYILEKKYFNENHFTNDQRREAVQARLHMICSNKLVDVVGPILKKLEKKEYKTAPSIRLLQDIRSLQQKLVEESQTEYVLIDETLDLYQSLLEQTKKQEELYQEIKRNHDELVGLKQDILREGKEIAGVVRSEIHRKICTHTVFILMAAITITSGVLLLYPQYMSIGYGLALSSSSLYVLYFLFEKSVSQESFYKMELYLQNLLDKKSNASVE